MSSTTAESYWPADRSVPVLHAAVGTVLRQAAADVPHKKALISVAPDRDAREWTYSELLEECERAASWLAAKFRPGEHIAVWAPNVPEWVVVQYGAAMAGLVLVTVNPALRGEELRYTLDRSDAVGLFLVGTFRGTDMAAIAEDALSDLDRVREVIRLETLLDLTRKVSSTGDLPDVDPTSPVQIQFTSGTTGKPKPALLSHEAMVTNAAHVRERSCSDPSVTYGTSLPLFHTAGCGLAGLGSVCHRATFVLAEVFDPATVLRSIEEHSVVVFGGVPTMLHAMYAFREKTGAALSSLRVLMSGGDTVPPQLMTAWEAAGVEAISAVYGQTELSPIICQTAATDSPQDRQHTVGLPLPHTEIAIVDPVSGQVVARGEEGEIRARGYQVMLGYYGMPDETSEVTDGDGWLRTGDRGMMDARGYVTVTGRLKDMIIRGGENIYPREIEDVLVQHPGIEQAAVVGETDGVWGETVAAVITLVDGQERPIPDELQAWMRERLAPHKTPKAWFVADDLPRNAMGKLQKFRLKEQIAEEELQPL